jgi:uncharacterized protein
MKDRSFTHPTTRIDVVDALRGLAVVAIMLLHNIEHFNFYSFPTETGLLMVMFDTAIWDTLFFLFAGKAYAIFALLFGFTFFLQLKSAAKRGIDFKNRYMWRLLLLFLIGNVNALFFPGEILVLYAIIGFILVPVRHLSNRVVLGIALFLMLQPLEWGKCIYALCNPDYVPANTLYSLRDVYPQLAGDSFVEMIKANSYTGQLASLAWGWNHGRFFQTAALFMLGMVMGRKELFVVSTETTRFWKKLGVGALLLYGCFWLLMSNLPLMLTEKVALKSLQTIIGSWVNVSFMFFLVSSFVLLYRVGANRVLKVLVPYGRMSLTNYVMQSIIGSFLYFGYGLGLYQTCGITYSFLIGLLFLTLQMLFCHIWLKHFSKGPLEALWHKGTWIDSKK